MLLYVVPKYREQQHAFVYLIAFVYILIVFYFLLSTVLLGIGLNLTNMCLFWLYICSFGY